MRPVDTRILGELRKEELSLFVLMKMIIDGTEYRYTDCDIPIVFDGTRSLVSNPGFETGDFVNWSQQNSSIESVEIHGGSYSAKLQASGSNILGCKTDPLVIDVTKRYTVDAWLYASSITKGNYYVKAMFYSDEAGTVLISSLDIIEIMVQMGTWGYISRSLGPSGSGADIIIPASTQSMRIGNEWYHADGNPTGIAYLDDVGCRSREVYTSRGFRPHDIKYSLRKVVDTLRFEIDNVDQLLLSAFQGGTPQGSDFILRVIVMGMINQLTNPGFDYGDFTGWTQNSSILETLKLKTGGYSAKLVSSGSNVQGAESEAITIDASKIHRVRSYNKVETLNTGDYYFRIIFYKNPDGSDEISTSNIKQYTAVTDWDLAEKTIGPSGSGADITIPSGAKSMAVEHVWWNAGGNPNGTVYMDDVRISFEDYNAIIGSEEDKSLILFEGEIDSWDLDESKIDIVVASIFTKWQQRTLSRHPPSCRWKKFKGDECKYAGGYTWCDRTYARCVFLNNSDNFGGFRWLPSIELKEVWWGSTRAV